ncbi:kremen protein 2-like, partial [Heptranchias perlo]|uniref:kremen protein 2-like n=1 Tax=Heptranchias perlo TaxID=212740 RepID=UPI00355AB57D
SCSAAPYPGVLPGPECFRVNGADYRGDQNQTSVVNGKPCLYWNQTYQHIYNTIKYPGGEWGLGNHNYCRNPDGDVQPWCYVSENEEGIYWKYCSIPSCSMPGYVGCFLDSGNPPALSGSSGTSTKLTVQVCIRFCRKKGYKYAGVEAGYACFCGNDVDLSEEKRVSAVECDQVCFGKSSELCGGDGRIGIYDVSVGACQGNSSRTEGVIYSPNFPDDYGPDSNCSWTLRPPGSGQVELDFRLFEIRDRNDRVDIRDGRTKRVLATYNGYQRPSKSLVFLTDYLIVTFTSDQILHDQGFALIFKGLQDNSSQGDDVTGFAQLPPTMAERLNSSVSAGKVTSIAVAQWVRLRPNVMSPECTGAYRSPGPARRESGPARGLRVGRVARPGACASGEWPGPGPARRESGPARGLRVGRVAPARGLRVGRVAPARGLRVGRVARPGACASGEWPGPGPARRESGPARGLRVGRVARPGACASGEWPGPGPARRESGPARGLSRPTTWAMYAATAIFVAIAVVLLYHLRKRSCLFVQKKSSSGVLVIKRPKDRCQCPAGMTWSVTYRHTRVVLCSEGRGEDIGSKYGCFCEGYNNLSVTNQSSLKSLISTI